MANTRLTLTAKNEISNAILELTCWPLRFMMPPGPLSTMAGKMEIWERLLPGDLVQHFKIAMRWGYAIPSTSTTNLKVWLDDRAVILNLGSEHGIGEIANAQALGFIQATNAVREDHWNDHAPVIAKPEAFFGSSEVIDWMRMSFEDNREAALCRKVLIDDLLEMCVTAGQMRRMVPDLLKYLPPEKVQCLHNQVRASTLPFEWAAYPREMVDRATTYMAKCHILTGLGTTLRQRMSRDEYATRVVSAA